MSVAFQNWSKNARIYTFWVITVHYILLESKIYKYYKSVFKISKIILQEYLGFPNELDSVLIIKKPLDYETLNNFTVTLRSQDAGSPPLHNDTTLQVVVLDADDQNPRFSHEHYTAVLPDDAREVGQMI